MAKYGDVLGPQRFNFPGWINHPEPRRPQWRPGSRDRGFNFPGWINHPEPYRAAPVALPAGVVSTSPDGSTIRNPGWHRGRERAGAVSTSPDGSTIRNIPTSRTVALLAIVSTSPDGPTTRTTGSPAGGADAGGSFNFPGWINHPEPLLTPKGSFAMPDKFQLPRMDQPSGTRPAMAAPCARTAGRVSTSPDGSTIRNHQCSTRPADVNPVSTSPDGSTIRNHTQKTHRREKCAVSTSPDGSTIRNSLRRRSNGHDHGVSTSPDGSTIRNHGHRGAPQGPATGFQLPRMDQPSGTFSGFQGCR